VFSDVAPAMRARAVVMARATAGAAGGLHLLKSSRIDAERLVSLEIKQADA